MCSVPVTFGGGSMIVYAGPVPEGLKQSVFSQWSYHFVSKVLGSKLLSMGFRNGGGRRGGRGAGGGEGANATKSAGWQRGRRHDLDRRPSDVSVDAIVRTPLRRAA